YRESRELVGLTPDDLIVDIGSNDGTLLKNYVEGGHKVLGVEPSRAGEVGSAQGVDTITAYFNTEAVDRILADRGPARMVTAANVFAHIAQPHDVVDGIV